MTKNENLNQLNNSSPFDGIRQFDEQGQEYWTARELMPLQRIHKTSFKFASIT